jgi:AAA ATPase domain
MPSSGEPRAEQHAPIIGREAGLARLRGLMEQVPLAGQVLLVTGGAGMGKTVLLADAVGRAQAAGVRVLSVTGRESESRLAFAGLHQLLRPVLSSAAGLPGRQAQALTGALGLAADAIVPDPLLTGVAVLTLLSDLSEQSPVLVVADDAQRRSRSLARSGQQPFATCGRRPRLRSPAGEVAGGGPSLRAQGPGGWAVRCRSRWRAGSRLAGWLRGG